MGPLGIFDSGLGGLTVLQQIRHRLPEIDLCYLGDNARVPYGNRSFETVYQFTREGVYTLLKQGAPLVVVACNTASAKALRSIQQKDLPLWQKEFKDGGPERRVLGVLRPTTEKAGELTQSGRLAHTQRKSSSFFLKSRFIPRLAPFGSPLSKKASTKARWPKPSYGLIWTSSYPKHRAWMP